MKVLETSFLVDYLNKQSYTLDYLNANAKAEYAVPKIALYELYAGAIRSNATSETIATVAEALHWTDSVAFTDSAAREAATKFFSTLGCKCSMVRGLTAPVFFEDLERVADFVMFIAAPICQLHHPDRLVFDDSLQNI